MTTTLKQKLTIILHALGHSCLITACAIVAYTLIKVWFTGPTYITEPNRTLLAAECILLIFGLTYAITLLAKWIKQL
jgi:hypothetical protein